MPLTMESATGAKIMDQETFNEIKGMADAGFCISEILEFYKKKAPKGKRAKVGLVALSAAYPFMQLDYKTYVDALEKSNKAVISKRKARQAKFSDDKENAAENDDIKNLVKEVLTVCKEMSQEVTENRLRLNQAIHKIEQLEKKTVGPASPAVDEPIKFPKAPFLGTPLKSSVNPFNKFTKLDKDGKKVNTKE